MSLVSLILLVNDIIFKPVISKKEVNLVVFHKYKELHYSLQLFEIYIHHFRIHSSMKGLKTNNQYNFNNT